MHKMKVIPFNLFCSSNFKPAFNQGVFFFLLQSEDGDLYKVTIEHEEEEVKSLRIKYFATLPAASCLCILISGFLFVASEFGNQSAHFLLSCSIVDVIFNSFLYQFQKLGDDDNEPEFSSTSYPSFGMANSSLPLPRAFFRPRSLENLVVAHEIESLDSIIDSKAMNLLLNSDTPQIFTACGRGPSSAFKTLRHGWEVDEFVISDLPGIPNAVWTTNQNEDGV